MASAMQSLFEPIPPLDSPDTIKDTPNSTPISPPLTPTDTHFLLAPAIELDHGYMLVSHENHDRQTHGLLDLHAGNFIPSAKPPTTPLQPLSKPTSRRKNNVRSFHLMRASFRAELPATGKEAATRVQSQIGNYRHRIKNTPTRSPSAFTESGSSDFPTFKLDVYDRYLVDPQCCLLSHTHKTSPPLASSLDSRPQYNESYSVGIRDAPSPASTIGDDIMDNSFSNISKRAFEKHNVKETYDSITNENEEQWVPTTNTLDTKTPRVVWKGSPLPIQHMPYYLSLHPKEARIASVMRLTPMQYIKCKHTLIQAAQQHARQGQPFKKSDAQKLCRVDVNKTSKLWEIFGDLGWFGPYAQLAH